MSRDASKKGKDVSSNQGHNPWVGPYRLGKNKFIVIYNLNFES